MFPEMEGNTNVCKKRRIGVVTLKIDPKGTDFSYLKPSFEMKVP
jgi:hypothetical protein